MTNEGQAVASNYLKEKEPVWLYQLLICYYYYY